MAAPSGREFRFRQAYERSLARMREAHRRAEEAIERTARLREAIRRSRDARRSAPDLGDHQATTLLTFAADEAARSVREKERFLAIVAHELRQPINAALAAIQMDRAAGGSEKYREIVERQLRQVTRLLDGLRQLTELSFDSGSLKLEPVHLASIITDALDAVRADAAGKSQAVRFSAAGSPVWVRGDSTRLFQVFANLLTNAARYTPEHGTIDVSECRDDGFAVVRVTDTGQGMTASELSRAFDSFTRGDGAPGSEGIGLGLSLVRSILTAHNGTVTASSAGPGRGSTFIVRLPLAVPPDRD